MVKACKVSFQDQKVDEDACFYHFYLTQQWKSWTLSLFSPSVTTIMPMLVCWMVFHRYFRFYSFFFPFFPFLPLRQDYLNGSIFKFANSVFCLFKLILNLSSDCFISITIHFISKISIRFHFIIAFYNYFLFQRYSSGFYEFFFLFMILFSSLNIFKAVGLNYFSSKFNTCVCSVTVSINVFFSPMNRPHFLISLHAFIFFSKTWTF